MDSLCRAQLFIAAASGLTPAHSRYRLKHQLFLLSTGPITEFGLALHPHAFAAICVSRSETDTAPFERSLDCFPVWTGRAIWVPVALDPPDRSQRNAAFFRQFLLIPVKKCAGRPDLT